MKEKPTFGRTVRWTWAVAFAVLTHVALYWGVALTRSSDQKIKRQDRQFTEIQYFDAETAERSVALSQQMLLFDPRPLLLPTEWNGANVVSLLGTWQEEAEIFAEFAPMFELEDGNYIDDFGNVPASYDRLTTAQVEFGFSPFRELGREEAGVRFSEELGMAVVLREPGGAGVTSQHYIDGDAVENLAKSWPDRAPMVLMATVENSFNVGGLAVLESSGFADADKAISRIVYEEFPRLGVLKDGVYLLEIVP